MSALQRALVLLAVPGQKIFFSPSGLLLSLSVLLEPRCVQTVPSRAFKRWLDSPSHRNLTPGPSPTVVGRSFPPISASTSWNHLASTWRSLLGSERGVGWISGFLEIPAWLLHGAAQVLPRQQCVQAAHLRVVVGSRSNGLPGLFFARRFAGFLRVGPSLKAAQLL